MKRQSVKWKSLALEYIANIVMMVHIFVVDLLRMICLVKRVQNDIMSLLMERLIEKYKASISHVDFLLEIELDGTSATLNHYFNDNLDKW